MPALHLMNLPKMSPPPPPRGAICVRGLTPGVPPRFSECRRRRALHASRPRRGTSPRPARPARSPGAAEFHQFHLDPLHASERSQTCKVARLIYMGEKMIGGPPTTTSGVHSMIVSFENSRFSHEAQTADVQPTRTPQETNTVSLYCQPTRKHCIKYPGSEIISSWAK
jgi:hypothetical protein